MAYSRYPQLVKRGLPCTQLFALWQQHGPLVKEHLEQ